MKPALSIILFTTIAGAAQGMVVALALAIALCLVLVRLGIRMLWQRKTTESVNVS